MDGRKSGRLWKRKRQKIQAYTLHQSLPQQIGWLIDLGDVREDRSFTFVVVDVCFVLYCFFVRIPALSADLGCVAGGQ